MTNLWNDIKHSLHMFIKNPGFTIAAVAALSLGIGANTAIFTVVNAVLLKPLSYPNADRIVQFLNISPDGRGTAASVPKFHVWQQQTNVFQEVAAYDFSGPGFNITGDRFQKTAGVAQLSREGRDRLNAIPGVERSASTCCLPILGEFGLPFSIVGRPVDPAKGELGSGWMSASPDYYKLFKIPVLQGREFTDSDTASAPLVMLINEALAKEFFPKQNPIGQQIVIGHGVGPEFEEPARQIVGVVGNTHEGGLNRDPGAMMIVPDAQVVDGITALNARILPIRWAIRTRGDPHQAAAAITEQLRLASGGFPVTRIRTMDEVVVRSTARETFNMLLLTIFGGVALVLAAIGIYGLMAYSAQQRTQEIGIRMALGADRSTIRRLVVWHGMRLALAGVALGVAAAFALTRLIASFLFGVKTWDPAVFIAVPIVLSAVALLAVWLPATRAAKLDPMQALRVE